MGISINSVLMLGNDYEEMLSPINDYATKAYGDEWEEDRDIHDIFEELDLAYTSPYYDSDMESWFIGIQISPLDVTDMNAVMAWNKELNAAKKKLSDICGDDIKFILCSQPHVT